MVVRLAGGMPDFGWRDARNSRRDAHERKVDCRRVSQLVRREIGIKIDELRWKSVGIIRKENVLNRERNADVAGRGKKDGGPARGGVDTDLFEEHVREAVRRLSASNPAQ